MGRRTSGVLLLTVCLGAPTVPAACAQDQGLSPAQVALFESDHLKEIAHPVVLDYSFRHRGGAGGDFDDKVSEAIRAIHPDGRKDVSVDFLTGDRHVDFPPVLGFKGNPLLMFFLEHDVNEMHAATGGAALYFRNRIRGAFADGAEMHPLDIEIAGVKRGASEITVAPYRNDPNLARFPAFAEKTYHFILSDAVPGTLYEIRTSLPARTDAGTFEETMTYAGEHAEKP